jgi:hypothetical protein
MKYSLKKIQAIVKKTKIIINNRKKKLGRESIVKGKYIICRHPFKSLSSMDPVGRVPRGVGSPFFSENVLKLCENCRK